MNMTSQTFLLELVTPERIAFSEQIDQVSVPTVDGEITILPNHIPLFSQLAEGELHIKQGAKDTYVALGGGYIQVDKKKTVILATRAFKADELNEKALLQAKQEAEDALKRKPEGEELAISQALLRSTLVDLKVLHRRRKPTL
jgi:F-type H+-transporting ATPase subunit epsilon